MREKDYYRDKCEYDKHEKDENSALANTKAIAINKNWNCLSLPCDNGYGGGPSWEKKKGCYDPRDIETMWKKGGYDNEEDSKESEAIASGKAAIFNKNINFVYRR